jgi:hypothetical protein
MSRSSCRFPLRVCAINVPPNRELINAFFDSAPAGVRGRVDLDTTGGTLCIPLGNQLDRVSEALRSIQARFDCRGPVLRLSFHLCNSVEEAILTGQAWRQ